jgi:hypothetical protein
MKQKLVSKTAIVIRASNNVCATVFINGDGVELSESFSKIKHLPVPMKTIASELWLDSGEVIRLPYNDSSYIIPDRTGVLMIFSDNSEGLKEFPKPNNAAIYNADGSLRFQLKAPKDWPIDRIHGVHVSKISSGKNAGMMEVLIASSSLGPPDCAWILNPNQPELIPTYQDVRY